MGKVERWIPLALYASTYLTTCVVAAVLVLAGHDSFIALFEYFSGTRAPRLTGDERRTALVLLAVPPAMLGLGYVAGLTVPAPRHHGAAARFASGLTRDRKPPLAAAVFAVLALGAFVSIASAGTLPSAASWLDYGEWVQARRKTFEEVSFLEFVNVYLFLPLAAAWAILADGRATLRSLAPRAVPVAITLALSLLLFQKKAAIVSGLIIIFAVSLFVARRRPAAAARGVVVGGAALVTLFFALVVVPVYLDTSKTVREAERTVQDPSPSPPGAAPSATPPSPSVVVPDERLEELGRELKLNNRTESLVLYSLLAPLTRTSVPALYYPIVFPRHHEFYGLDTALDIVGAGDMPDDNIVVWRFMNDDIPGSTAAPFQFVLYSQVGTVGAVLLSALVGLLLALTWRLARWQLWPELWSALAGAMVLLACVYFAIDSLRNSSLVSYGVVWGFVFLASAAGLAEAVGAASQRVRAQRRPTTPTNQP